MTSEKFSYRKRLKSFVHAFSGICTLFKEEHNAWIHLFVTVVVVIAGLFFEIDATEWLFIVIAIGIVFSAELLNSALENLCNVVSKAHHPAIKKAKDMAAGAVLVVSIAAAIGGLIIFIPYVLKIIN